MNISSSPARLAFALCTVWSAAEIQAAEMTLKIQSDFPGGNVKVESIQGNTARIAPDLRTTPTDWIYWNFSTEASQAGRAQFIFKGIHISTRGPAFSLDDGKTWKWLGKEHVTYCVPKGNQDESFYFDFTQPGQKVRFSVGFPYVESNLSEFTAKHAANPNLIKSTLTKSLKGRPVELLQIGKPGPGISSVLVAARSHCCEALASYVLEGLLDEAMSDSPAGVAFRKKYVLYAAPFLDKDGVEDGDQGKNRAPHDHNRDYGSNNIYPEIKALQNLAKEKDIRVAIDFHCPFLRGDIHEAYHWLGLKVPHIASNMEELNGWLAEERPLGQNTALSLLKKVDASVKTEGIPFSWYFAQQPNSLIGVTLESPYAQAENTDAARNYGRGLLRALVRTELVNAEPGSARGDGSFEKFAEYRKQLSLILGKPDEAKAAIQPYIDNPAAPAIYRAQANLAMLTMKQRQKQFAEALAYAKAVVAEPGATANQKATALGLAITIHCADPKTSTESIDAALAELEAYPFAAPLHRAKAYKDISGYYSARGDRQKALAFAEKRIPQCVDWEKSGAILEVANILDAMNKPAEAIERRKEVVALLKPQVLPAPNGKGIFLGAMTVNYFDAVNGIPTSTFEEKMEAAQVVVNFPNHAIGQRERVQKWIEENRR